MEAIKLSLKDKRILALLDKEPNLSYSKIAKKVGISRQVAEYRIRKLLSQKTIYAFYTLIDVGRLGYSSFRIHLRVKNVSQEIYSKFAEKLFKEYPTFWVGFMSGSFDIIMDIFAKNFNEFDKILRDILKKNQNIVQNYDVLAILELDLYDYGYFLEKNPNRNVMVVHKNESSFKLDETDKKILKIIKYDSRISYEEIGKKVRLSRNAVKQRIKKLEEKKIIAGYKILVNFNHFDKQSFKILIKYNNSKINQEKVLLEEIRQTCGVLDILRFIGKWDLDIEIQMKDYRELQEFIIGLRNKYGIIDNYEIVRLIDDYGIDFYPDKLNK
jgi:DNA-binding Lrp family transcriptional regulator